MKKLIAMLMVVVMLVACTPIAAIADDAEVPTYTYHGYATSLGTNWNPHTWETNADDSIMEYLTTPFVNMQILDSEDGIYQWTYEAATYVSDVTADNQADLEKYPVNLPEGMTAADVTEGYVYEIGLNPDLCWENGTPINADSYIYSMQQLLTPEMKNYRANLYYAGESAVAGGNAFYYSDQEGYYMPAGNYFESIDEAVSAGSMVYVNCWDFWGAQGYVDAEGNECPQYVAIDDETVYGEDVGDPFSGADLWNDYAAYLEVGADYSEYACVWAENESMGATYDTVGCYKVDDYTIRYVCENYIDINYFLTSLTSNWLVYEELYEAGKDTSGTLVTTNYCSTADTTMSYGPYRIASLQDEKQLVFVQNETYYAYEQQEDGSLLAITPYEVDGEHVQRYQATSVVFDVMTDDAAKQAFLKGDLDTWTPNADEVVTYATSEQLYKVDETYTESFFFCTGVELLQEMDNSKGNTNSVVLSNINFRKAMSLSIDRQEFVSATAGWKPAYSLMNSLYHYDIYNDPTSSYRSSEEAMQAICNVYGVEYGEGTPYASLKEAYASINGYNLTEAKALMAQACEELVAAGLYIAGEPIVIRIGFKKGALDSTDNQQVELMNKYVNAAAEGSGFGAITLEAIGNIPDRYGDVAKGEYAIGWGAWGGAAFYPFRNMQVYCDTEQYSIHEAGCWDPATTNLTINIDGEDVTMSWLEWSGSCIGTGKYSTADFATKLHITATMEENYLNFVYRIPFASTTGCELLGYKVNYYTDEYNIMYGFGGGFTGVELMSFNYSDAEWAEYVASQGGILNYE